MIKGHLAANKMLSKSIKDHPIVVGTYANWLVINYGMREAMDGKIMATKITYKVDEVSSSSASYVIIIN